jgi:hypothetical protein
MVILHCKSVFMSSYHNKMVPEHKPMQELKSPRFSQMNPVGCKQGMVAGVVFRPISFQTLLGHSR